MKLTPCLAFLIIPAAACSTPAEPTPTDLPRLIAASGDRVVVAGSVEEPETELGCGGGDDPAFGSSVVFVSADRGASFTRVVPVDRRPLARIVAHDGVFYGLAQDPGGGFAVVSSVDGAAWTEVATGTATAHDLSASAAGLAVALATGVLTSADAVTWIDHPLGGDGLYAPSVAVADVGIAIGTAGDGTLRVSTDTEVWTDHAIPQLAQVWQLIPADDAVIIGGLADLGDGVVPVIGRVDLTRLDAAPEFRAAAGESAAAVLTPAGLLEPFGTLSEVTASGVGAPAAHIDPFISAAVDGDLVAVLRDAEVAISIDGGVGFASPALLPLGDHGPAPSCTGEDCGRLAP